MTATKPIFIRFAFAQHFVKNAYTEFHKNPNNDLVTDRQTDRQTDIVPQKASSALRKGQLETEMQFVNTKCGHRAQHSTAHHSTVQHSTAQPPTACRRTSDSDGRCFFRASDISSDFRNVTDADLTRSVRPSSGAA